MWEHPFTDKRTVITEPAVPRARRSGLGSKLYPSNLPRMLNKDLTGFKQIISRVRQKLSKKKKGLCCQGGRNEDNPNSRLFWGPTSQALPQLQLQTSTHQLYWKIYFHRGSVSLVCRGCDCGAGGRGFDSQGWANTQGLKITEKWRYSLCDLRLALMTT